VRPAWREAQVAKAHQLAPEISPVFEVAERVLDTLIGVSIAWVFSYVLPSWERTQVGALVARHNGRCRNKAELYDFMAPNALTRETLQDGSSADYVDLVHFRPPAGLWLLRQMGIDRN